MSRKNGAVFYGDEMEEPTWCAYTDEHGYECFDTSDEALYWLSNEVGEAGKPWKVEFYSNGIGFMAMESWKGETDLSEVVSATKQDWPDYADYAYVSRAGEEGFGIITKKEAQHDAVRA